MGSYHYSDLIYEEERKRMESQTQLTQTVSVKLKQPLMRGETEVKELTFRRPKGRDLKRMMSKKKEWDQTTELMLTLNQNQLTPEEIDDMDGSDVLACGEKIATFLE